MKALIASLMLMTGSTLPAASAPEIQALVEQLKNTAKPDAGIGAATDEVTKKLQAAGAEAIPFLLPLLHDKNDAIRAAASYTLRDMSGLTEKDLDALIESRQRGDGWIPPAIARIGTPKAVAFLVEELVREHETHTQVTYAIEILGAKAVPDLVRIYQSGKGWNDEVEQTLYFIFRELGAKAADAIDPLLKIAIDESAPVERRRRAAMTLSSIGLTAERVAPGLVKLMTHSNAAIRDAAKAAILELGSADAAPLLADMLEKNTEPGRQPDEAAFRKILIIRDIAQLKLRGRAAGPALVKYLTDNDWRLRSGAARALGFIGYEPATADLIKLLSCEDDWQAVWNSVQSLGQLRSDKALIPLSQVMQDHWYPPVRAAALAAIKATRDHSPVFSPGEADNFAMEFFQFEHAGDEMESLQFDEADLVKFPTVDAEPVPPPAIEAQAGKVMFHGIVGLKIKEGYLTGTDNGEWGGRITFVDPKGNAVVVLEANTKAIYPMRRGVIAVTGLAHMMSNEGMLYQIRPSNGGGWEAVKWRRLPGAPYFSRLLKDGNLLVSCIGGIVLVSPDGVMTSLTRSEALLPGKEQKASPRDGEVPSNCGVLPPAVK